MNEQEMTEFVELFMKYQDAKGLATKSVSTGNTSQLMHGAGGLFGATGLNREILSTIYQPKGLGARLPKLATNATQPYFSALTGQGAAQGTNPSTACGDPRRAGLKTTGTLTAQFGFDQVGTDTIDPSEIITTLNRGEFTDLTLIGSLYNNDTNMGPAGMNDSNQVLNNAIYNQMNGVGIEFERSLSSQLWRGAIANNNGSGYKEFPGLDSQIATGQVDAISNVTVPSLDSYVDSLAYDMIDGSGRDIVRWLSTMEYYLVDLAERTGVTVTWAIVMRPTLWQELTDIWPISYSTNRGSILSGNTRMVIDGGDMVAARDAMRRSMTLEVNARSYPVITDTGINEKNNITNAQLAAGQYASSIYMIPLTVNGMPVTRMEYLDYRVIAQYLGSTGELANKVMFWSPDGMFLWVYRDLPGYCFDLVARTQQRVILQAPHLAGRIDNVGYRPIRHLREPDPSNPYYADGGVSLRNGPTTYAVWK